VRNQINASKVIRCVFKIYVDQASVLIPTAAIVFLVTGSLSTVLTKTSRGTSLLSVLVDLVGVSLLTGLVVELVADIRDGRRDASVGQLVRSVTPVLSKLIFVGFVAAIVEGIGFVMLVVPGFVLLTIWSVFAPVVVLERPAGLRALSRSRELVRGNGWRVFVVILVLVILVGIVAEGVAFVDRSEATAIALVVRVFVDTLAVPIAALASAVLYFDLREVAGGVGTG
jgi:hypothetical protein